MIRRIEARISSIEGSCAFADWAIACALSEDPQRIKTLPLDALPPFWLSRGFELACRRLAESDDKDACPAIIKDLEGLNAKSGWTALALLALVRSEHARTLLARHADVLLEGKGERAASLIRRAGSVAPQARAAGFDVTPSSVAGSRSVEPSGAAATLENRLQNPKASLRNAQQLNRRLGEFQDNAVWLDDGARPQDDALDASLGDGRDQAAGFVDRHQRAESTHVHLHRAAFDGIDPYGCPFDGRRRRLEACEHHRNHADDDDAHRREHDSAKLFLARY